MDARTAQVNAILGRVRDAAAAFERRAVPATEEIENLVVSTAFSVAESIVGASLRDDETRGMAALARALALSPVGAPAVIALNPHDHALLGAKATELAQGHDVQIVADPSLRPGDATVSQRRDHDRRPHQRRPGPRARGAGPMTVSSRTHPRT